MNADIDIMKIMKENRAVALMVSAVLILVLVYIIAFVPMIKELRVKYQECRMIEGRLADARSLVQMGRDIYREYGGRTLISEQEAAVGIEEFTRYGKSLGVNFLSIKPHDVIRREGSPYKILPIELSFESGGEQFVKFMGSIDELKKAIVTIETFDVTPAVDDRRKLKVNMVIDIYLSLQENSPEGA